MERLNEIVTSTSLIWHANIPIWDNVPYNNIVMFEQMSFFSTITNKHDGNMVEENIRRPFLGQQTARKR